MRRLRFAVLTTAAVAAFGAVFGALVPGAQAEEIDWIPTLEKGLEEAKRSGRSVLYVTLWKPGT